MWCALLFAASLANQGVAASHNAQSAVRATPSLWQLDSTTILPPSTLSVALSAGALKNPVMCTSAVGRAPLIGSEETVGVAIAHRVADDVDVGVDIPVGWADFSDGPCGIIEPRSRRLRGLFDAGGRLRAKLLSPSDDVAIVGVIDARVPTAWFLGKPELGAFGDPLGSVTMSLVASATIFDVTVTGQGGAVYRPFPGSVWKSAMGNGFVFGAGVEVGVISDLVAVAEVSGAVVETQTLGERALQVPLELTAGVKYQWGPLEVRGALGGGLIDGVGAPQQRATVAVSYHFGTDFPERRPFSLAPILALSSGPPTAEEARQQAQEQDQKRRQRCPPGEMVPGCPPPSAPKRDPPPAYEFHVDDDVDAEILAPITPVEPTIEVVEVIRVQERVITLLFDVDSAVVTAAHLATLRRELEALGGPPQSTRVEAHASRTGSSDHNAMLAAARAMAVTAALTSMVPPETLSSSSFGDTDPLVPVVEDEAASRRVRVVLTRTLPATTRPASDDEVKR